MSVLRFRGEQVRRHPGSKTTLSRIRSRLSLISVVSGRFGGVPPARAAATFGLGIAARLAYTRASVS